VEIGAFHAESTGCARDIPAGFFKGAKNVFAFG
jgi:hypothetical protein